MDRSAAVRCAAVLAAVLVEVLAGCGGARGHQRQDAPSSAVLPAVNKAAPGQQPGTWEIEYALSGGFAGIRRHLRLSSSGTLVATDLKKQVRIERQASSDQLAEIAGLLAKLDLPGMPERQRAFPNACADCFQHTLTVIVNGQEYRQHWNDLSLPDSPYAPLVGPLSSMLQQALLSREPGR